MENQKMNSLKIIVQQLQNFDQKNNDYKFKRISDKSIQSIEIVEPFKIYKDTVKKCQDLNQHIFQIEKFINPSVLIKNQSNIQSNDLQEPQKPEIKVKINVEKSPCILRSKSQNKSLLSFKRNLSAANKNKAHTFTRFQSQSNQKLQNKSIINTQNEPVTSHHRHLSNNLNDHIDSQEKINTNPLNKKVRVKSSSIASLSAKNNQQKRFKKFIPLKQFNVKQPSSFFQNAYRVRRQNQSLWKANSNHWNSFDNLKKNRTKMTLNLKQSKKIVFQGYDFDGQLIPSFYASQKQKKFTEEKSKMQIQPLDEFAVQNLKFYQERNRRTAKTIKQLRFQHPELIQSQSQFLKNFQNLQWNENIEQMQIQSSDRIKKVKLHSSNKVNKSNDNQDKKILHQQQLISQFQKIKQSEGENNFQLGFSKYVKAKKFIEKQTKSKSYNHQTYKYLPLQPQDKNENDDLLRLNSSPKKGPQKIRANKRLFKQLFNTSLKHIQPENREDIATIKLIKDTEKQNAESLKKQQHLRDQKAKLTRKSDTALLKKGFQIKLNFLNELAKFQRPVISKITKNSQSKRNLIKNTQFQSEFSVKEDSIQQSSYQRFSQISSPSISQRKKSFSNERKSLINFNENHVSSDIQKMFKKETKKVLFKHSVHESRKQNFL